MKNFRQIWQSLAIGLVATAALAACSDDPDEPNPVKLAFEPLTGVENVTFEQSKLTVTSDGATVAIGLTDANEGSLASLNLTADVTGTGDTKWCKAQVSNGKLQLVIDPYTDKEKERTADVRVFSDATYVAPVSLQVVQKTLPKLTASSITAFSLAEQAEAATIDQEAKTIAVTVKRGTDVTKLAPAIEVSEGASVSPASGAEQDFTEPVKYTVTSEDGKSTTEYTVTVTVVKNSEAKLLGFVVTAEPRVAGTIDEEKHTVELVVPYATTWPWASNKLTTTFEATVSEGATGSIVYGDDGWSYDYSFQNGATYTVVSEDEQTTVKYTIKAKYAPSPENDLTGILFTNPETGEPTPGVYSSVIDLAAKKVTVYIKPGADVSALTPTLTLSKGATVEPASGSAQNFAAPVKYTVTAEDGKAKAEYTIATAELTGISVEMIDVEPGTFTYGESPDYPQDYKHEVTLTKKYAIGKFELTQDVFVKLMGFNPAKSAVAIGDKIPANNVTWYDAVVFCNRLSELSGLAPVYKFEKATYSKTTGRLTHAVVVYDHAAATGYRLPTAAEWEFAARGGNQSKNYPFSGGDDANEVSWNRDNSKNNLPKEVGGKKANELGIYDMSGNVYEWVYDWGWPSKTTITEPQTDPVGYAGPEGGVCEWGDGNGRYQYGGGANSSGIELSYTYTRKNSPETTGETIGFRIALTK